MSWTLSDLGISFVPCEFLRFGPQVSGPVPSRGRGLGSKEWACGTFCDTY